VSGHPEPLFGAAIQHSFSEPPLGGSETSGKLFGLHWFNRVFNHRCSPMLQSSGSAD